MRPFRFTLERILEFRASRLAQEETKLEVLRKELADLGKAIDRVERARQKSGQALVTTPSLQGWELEAVAGFQIRLGRELAALQREKSAFVQSVVRQTEIYTKAWREHRMLEKLRRRQFVEWLRGTNRELDKLASELYLSRRHGRGRSKT